MQTQRDASTDSPFPTLAFSPGGVFGNTDHLAWCRRDWRSPVGTFEGFHEEKSIEVLGDQQYLWTLRRISRLSLSHTATLLMLQGMQLKHLLLSNYYVRHRLLEEELLLGEVLLRVDPWNYRKTSPELTNLALVSFHGAVDEVVQQLLPRVIAATA